MLDDVVVAASGAGGDDGGVNGGEGVVVGGSGGLDVGHRAPPGCFSTTVSSSARKWETT